MPYEMTLAILANSRKPGGTCVAGLEASSLSRWIRPVSARATEEISAAEQAYTGGGAPQLLDLVRIRSIEARPHGHQQENRLIDDTTAWRKVGTLPWENAVQAAQDVVGPLWENGHQSAYRRNNRVPGAVARRFAHSLMLVVPENVRMVVAEEDSFRGRRVRVSARFNVAGHEYILEVTDPAAEQAYRRRGIGEYDATEALFCVSLGEVFDDGNAYKLVAGVIQP
jgi:hypothetical protein